jgi:hypothetical protein
MDGRAQYFRRVPWHERCPVRPTYKGIHKPRTDPRTPNCSCLAVYRAQRR